MSYNLLVKTLYNVSLNIEEWEKGAEHFHPSLHFQWKCCNALVLSWIIGSMSKELSSNVPYSQDALAVWREICKNDLNELMAPKSSRFVMKYLILLRVPCL